MHSILKQLFIQLGAFKLALEFCLNLGLPVSSLLDHLVPLDALTIRSNYNHAVPLVLLYCFLPKLHHHDRLLVNHACDKLEVKFI